MSDPETVFIVSPFKAVGDSIDFIVGKVNVLSARGCPVSSVVFGIMLFPTPSVPIAVAGLVPGVLLFISLPIPSWRQCLLSLSLLPTKSTPSRRPPSRFLC